METTNNNTKWTNLRSTEIVKQEQRASKFDIGTRNFKDRFSCGAMTGLVSEKAVKHLQGGGAISDLVVGHAFYLDKEGKPAECDMLRLAGGGAPTNILWSF